MKVKIKKISDEGIIPSYSKVGDAGLDLTATSMQISGYLITYKTGLSIEIPEGYVGLLFPRSSICKYDLQLTNSVGVIDSGYRGEIMLKFAVLEDIQRANIYSIGDRIGQLIILPYPQIELEPNLGLDELSKLYGRATLFWHACGLNAYEPEKSEHFGMTTVEAMQCHTVPIVIKRGGQPEIVEHGKSGYLFDDITSLKEYTLTLIKDEKMRVEMSGEAFQRSQKFSLECFNREIEAVFNDILNSYFSEVV
jgi:dUTP pyrophosphatase